MFRVDYDKQKDVVAKLACPRATLIAYKGGKEVKRMSWETSQASVVNVLKAAMWIPSLTLPLAFAAGMLTILSPCVLPLAPVVVASARALRTRAARSRWAFGLAVTFGVVGGVLASFGVEFGDWEWARTASAIIMIAIGRGAARAGDRRTRSSAGSVSPTARRAR